MKRGFEEILYEPCKRACSGPESQFMAFSQPPQAPDACMWDSTAVTNVHHGYGPGAGLNMELGFHCGTQYRQVVGSMHQAAPMHEDSIYSSSDDDRDCAGENYAAHQQWWASYMQQVGCGAIVPE